MTRQNFKKPKVVRNYFCRNFSDDFFPSTFLTLNVVLMRSNKSCEVTNISLCLLNVGVSSTTIWQLPVNVGWFQVAFHPQRVRQSTTVYGFICKLSFGYLSIPQCCVQPNGDGNTKMEC